MSEFSIEFADWTQDCQTLIEIRTEVFINEQQVPVNLEVDGMDPQCLHVKAQNTDAKIVGTARLLPSSYIGRMCVLKQFRHRGVGGQMLDFLIRYARQQEIHQLMLNAQLSALPFYRRFGFEPDSDIFIEAGIKHKHMTLTLAK